MKTKQMEKPKGVLSRYLAGGTWKSRIIAKMGKGRSEKCKSPRIYQVVAPVGGWPGGHPNQNGCKHAK